MRKDRWPFLKRLAAIIVPTLLLGGSRGLLAQRPAGAPAPRPGAAASQPQYKGIWEPVNYSEDVALNGVFFVTVDEGWVTGGTALSKGVLLHTTDGGDHWEVALGDPAGSQRQFYNLRFVDQTTGFVVQGTQLGGHSLLRTTDGTNWQVTGTVPEHHRDYRFFSATVGVTSTGHEIDRTTDAGRTWRKVFDCALKVEVGGLTRNIHCEIASFHFPSTSTGYGIGFSYEAKGLLVFKTEDAGATWTGGLAVPGEENGNEGHVFFTNEQTGYVCTAKGTFFGTTDGGQTWTGLPGASCEGKAEILFADPEVGWTFRYAHLTYTLEGGRRWVARQIALPASVHAFSLPRRDRGYAVGDHGMIYRYRVVPVETAVAKAVEAPAMPAFATPLDARVGDLQQQVGGIESSVQAAAPGGGSGEPAAGAGAVAPPAASPAAGAPAAPDAAALVAGTPAATPFIANCCGKRLSAFESVLKLVGGIVPDFISKYKNLNIVAQGLRMAAQLPEKADSLKAAINAFRSASDRPSAIQALGGLKSLLDGFKAAVDTAVQKKAAP